MEIDPKEVTPGSDSQQPTENLKEVDGDGKGKSYDLSEISGIISLLKENPQANEVIQTNLKAHFEEVIPNNVKDQYNILFLYDDFNSIGNFHSNKIYNSIKKLPEGKDVLLIIQSGGGKIEPAYFISKLCKRFSKEKFVVVVPRKAKSAATLIALGGQEIHMGPLSELGPIDPQIADIPTLGLSNAIGTIASLVAKYPSATDLFAKYLDANLHLGHLGYFERLNESAAQYAERLLQKIEYPNGRTATDIAKHFVYHYKDHGFVIDYDEAEELLGDKIIRKESDLYDVANYFHVFFDSFKVFSRMILTKRFRFVGSIENGLHLEKIKKEDKKED